MVLGHLRSKDAVPDNQRVAVVPIAKMTVSGVMPTMKVGIVQRFVPKSLEGLVDIPAKIRVLLYRAESLKTL